MSALELLLEERFQLMQAGLSPLDWSAMTPWEREDLLYRHNKDVRRRFKHIEKATKKESLNAIIKQVVTKLLGG